MVVGCQPVLVTLGGNISVTCLFSSMMADNVHGIYRDSPGFFSKMSAEGDWCLVQVLSKSVKCTLTVKPTRSSRSSLLSNGPYKRQASAIPPHPFLCPVKEGLETHAQAKTNRACPKLCLYSNQTPLQFFKT